MKPIVLISAGDFDADFTYAAGLPLEGAMYIRFGDGDDVAVVSVMEFERAKVQGKAARVQERSEAGYEEKGPFASWARLAAKLLRERGHESARVSPRLQAGHLEELRAAGIDVEVDVDLFRADRRRKSGREARVDPRGAAGGGSRRARGRDRADEVRHPRRPALAGRRASHVGAALRQGPAGPRADRLRRAPT